MSKAIERIKARAEALAFIRLEIAALEEAHRQELEQKKASRDTIQNELLVELRKEGLTSIKTSNGDSYSRATRRGVDIINPIAALSWAKEHGAIAIDRRLVAQRLAEFEKMPPGFQLVETEFISVHKPKAKKAEATEE
jgi:hypothetical protein